MADGDAPTVTVVDPVWVPAVGGVVVTITGSGFSGATAVSFDDLGARFVVDSDTQIRVTAPDSTSRYTSSSQLATLVVTPNGTSERGPVVQFGNPPQAAAPAGPRPAITAVDPVWVPAVGGVVVTITGSGFSGATAVSFDDLGARFVVDSDTQIRVTAPDSTSRYTSSSQLATLVVTPNGTSERGPVVQFGNPPQAAAPAGPRPAITAVEPVWVPAVGGVVVTITGSGFSGATAVSFDDLGARFVVDSDTQIRVTAPDSTSRYTSSSQLATLVVTPNGTSERGPVVQFGNPPQAAAPAGPRPAITAVDPVWVPAVGGVVVTITGSGFSGATAVSFDDLGARFVVDSDTQIRVTAPDSTSRYTSSSQLATLVVTPNDTSERGPVVQFGNPPQAAAPAGPRPAITAVEPVWVPAVGGVVVTITGSGFSGATAVSFDDLGARFVVDSDTQIRVTAPDSTSRYTSSSQLATLVVTPNGTSERGPVVQFGNPP